MAEWTSKNMRLGDPSEPFVKAPVRDVNASDGSGKKRLHLPDVTVSCKACRPASILTE